MSFATIIAPKSLSDSSIMSFLESTCVCFLSSSLTSSANFSEVVISIEDASVSCSACESKSAATNAGFTCSSAITSISLGPAIMSISTKP